MIIFPCSMGTTIFQLSPEKQHFELPDKSTNPSNNNTKYTPAMLHNRTFERSGQMIQNHTCWDTSCTVGLPKQSNSYQSSLICLCFGSPTVQLASQQVWFWTMWPDRAKGLYSTPETGVPYCTIFQSLSLQSNGCTRFGVCYLLKD